MSQNEQFASPLPMPMRAPLPSPPPQTTGTPAMGQTNVSYTLMADISSLFFTKLLNYMRDNDMVKVRPFRLNHITVYPTVINRWFREWIPMSSARNSTED